MWEYTLQTVTRASLLLSEDKREMGRQVEHKIER